MGILYIVSTEQASGKTAVCAGLARNYLNEGKKVGYLKPHAADNVYACLYQAMENIASFIFGTMSVTAFLPYFQTFLPILISLIWKPAIKPLPVARWKELQYKKTDSDLNPRLRPR